MASEIAYILCRYPTISNTFVVREVLELERRGLTIHIYVLETLSKVEKHPEHDLIKAEVIYLPQWKHWKEKIQFNQIVEAHLWFLRRKPLRYLNALIQLLSRREFRSRHHRLIWLTTVPLAKNLVSRPQITHIHGYFAGDEASAALMAHWLTGLPFSFTVHAPDTSLSSRALRAKVAAAKFIISDSQFNSQAIVEQCGAGASGKIHLVRTGVDLKQFAAAREKRLARQNQHTANLFSILTVARLVPPKGYPYLVEALALLKARKRQFRWVVAGDGPCRDEIEGLIQKHELADWTQLLGSVQSTEVKELMAEADVFVLPSISTERETDGIPVAEIDAMASCLPVISTRISGIPELITDNVNGLLVESRSAEALADAIERIMDDPDLAKRLALGGLERVTEEFQLTDNVTKIQKLFDGAIH